MQLATDFTESTTHSSARTNLWDLVHDLKNPAGNILLLVGLLEKELAARGLGADFGYVTLLNRCCREMMALVDGLTEAERDFQRHRHPMERICLRDFVTDFATLYPEVVRAKDLRFVLALPDRRIPVMANRFLLGRALDNLLVNAIRFTPPGGKISVSLHRSRGYASLAIADTGVGIPPDVLPRLFDSFPAVSRQGTEGEASNGMGLLTVKKIIEQHRGALRVRSEEGKGSAFLVRIPTARKTLSAG